MPPLLEPEAVHTLLMELPDWKLQGDSIERVREFKGFREAISFVDSVAREAEALNHHPDIDIRYRKVRLVLSTHSAGGLTSSDFNLARKLDAIPDPVS
ncbi:MAG: 4a-hydroxytetrahydrobiopterin dehydratase [Verrucomicrobia bacterium]|nr:4a-hydroxytetrahydrobiopterin dehydratase [Verrucomicrobiota bacterium]